MIRKVAMSAMGLVFIGSSVFAQSLADAKKAIDAEKYQSAKSMLTNLTQTQPTNDENYFYLGWVYLIQDHPDSAKLQFNKGIAINPKSALNYAGLGAVARVTKDAAGANTNFTQAITLAPKKDANPYLYVGKSYLLPIDGNTAVSAADAAAAISILEKGKALNPKMKNAEIDLAIGNANLSQLKSSDADSNFSEAIADDPKSLPAYVAKGALLRMAHNWDGAVAQFQAALAIDPNFGPAYREWAETDYRQGDNDHSVASAKIKEAVEHYKKYLDLTDRSFESQLRYADFLINAGDYTTLQQVASDLSKSKDSNLRVYRYIGIAAYQNKDYANGISAMNKFINEAGSGRVIGSDYAVLGRLKLASNDSTGVLDLQKAYTTDTTKTDVLLDVATYYKDKKDYPQEAAAYQQYFDKSGAVDLNGHYYMGLAYYYAFGKTKDSTMLAKSDSAFSYVNKKAANPVAGVVYYRALVNDLKDGDRANFKGLAKPFYDQYISIMSSKAALTASDKSSLADAYAYQGIYAELKDKDDAKALESYNKAKEYDPANADALNYFSRKAATKK